MGKQKRTLYFDYLRVMYRKINYLLVECIRLVEAIMALISLKKDSIMVYGWTIKRSGDVQDKKQ